MTLGGGAFPVCFSLVSASLLSVPVDAIDWKNSKINYSELTGTLYPTHSLMYDIF